MSKQIPTDYIIKTTDCDVALFSSPSRFCAAAVDVRRAGLKVRCCWKGSGVKLLLRNRPAMDATEPPTGEERKGVVRIRLFEVVPTASPPSRVRRKRRGVTCFPSVVTSWITSLLHAKRPKGPMMRGFIQSCFGPSPTRLHFLEGVKMLWRLVIK